MNEELQFNHMASYELAEQKAAHYFNTLSAQVLQKSFIPTLTKDFNSWKQHHIHAPAPPHDSQFGTGYQLHGQRRNPAALADSPLRLSQYFLPDTCRTPRRTQ